MLIISGLFEKINVIENENNEIEIHKKFSIESFEIHKSIELSIFLSSGLNELNIRAQIQKYTIDNIKNAIQRLTQGKYTFQNLYNSNDINKIQAILQVNKFIIFFIFSNFVFTKGNTKLKNAKINTESAEVQIIIFLLHI